ncbi:MAG: patatin-like phospholipase family protein [Bacteroidota bacterium]
MNCLIVEGVGFKTGFTSGVLDAFQMMNYRPFDLYLGVSGGSIATSYFLSKQYRQCITAIKLLAKDKEFTQFTRTFGEEGYMDIDFLKRVAEEKTPLNLPAALAALKAVQVYFVATIRANGQPAYLIPDEATWLDILIASSTLPFVTKGRHHIKGVEYFDGGWSDPIPARWAYQKGARRILVVRTAPAERKTKQSLADYFGSLFYRDNQHLSNTFAQSHILYNDSVEFLLDPPKDVVVEQIAPIKELKSTTYTYTPKSIMSDYRYGLDVGLRYLYERKLKGEV